SIPRRDIQLVQSIVTQRCLTYLWRSTCRALPACSNTGGILPNRSVNLRNCCYGVRRRSQKRNESSLQRSCHMATNAAFVRQHTPELLTCSWVSPRLRYAFAKTSRQHPSVKR